MLRINVNGTDGARNYSIPSSNPWVGKPGRNELWSRGLRNPWGWSFDRDHGRPLDRRRRPEHVRGDQSIPRVDDQHEPWSGGELRRRVIEGRHCYLPATAAAPTRKVLRSWSTPQLKAVRSPARFVHPRGRRARRGPNATCWRLRGSRPGGSRGRRRGRPEAGSLSTTRSAGMLVGATDPDDRGDSSYVLDIGRDARSDFRRRADHQGAAGSIDAAAPGGDAVASISSHCQHLSALLHEPGGSIPRTPSPNRSPDL